MWGGLSAQPPSRAAFYLRRPKSLLAAGCGLLPRAAATRRTLDGKNPEGWVPEQKITVAEAIRGYENTMLPRSTEMAKMLENGAEHLLSAVVPDFGERYLSSLLFDELRQQALATPTTALAV